MADKKNKKECPVRIETLAENYRIAQSNYSKIHRKLKLLDAVDKSKLWEAMNAKYPKYQILPETNWISYIKNNLLASIYTVAKGASILPTCEEDKDIITNINIALEHIWDTCDVGHYQMQAGSNAALFNLGVTQVGWDPNITSGKNTPSFYKGNVVLKNIHPINYMRDPFAEDLEHAAYCMTWANLHKTTILNNNNYHDNFLNYLKGKENASAFSTAPIEIIREVPESQASTDKDYYKVYYHFAKYYDEESKEIRIAEIHTLNNDIILWYNPDVKPRRFPFVELFCNLPEGDVIGTSECMRVLSNNIAYNIMSSMILTGEYKNQRPAKFVSSQSGLNIHTFSKHGNDPERTFIVNGDATKAVHYNVYPQPSAAAAAVQVQLLTDIQMTSGVDGRYTGRDTGSVITTGGVEDMLNRVTLIDTPKIANYERYARQLTELILANFVEFSMKRKYFRKDATTGDYGMVEVEFPKLPKDTIYSYAINISSELPKNKQRIAAMANTLMEKQMQYGANGNGPDLITTEEWLNLQDLPFKELMLKRMGVQRIADATAEFAGGLFDYAALIKNGVAPDDAVGLVGENMAAKRVGQPEPIDMPPLDPVLTEAQQAQLPVDPMAAMQSSANPVLDPGLLNQMTMGNMPAVPEQPQIDPSLLAELGNM